MLVYTEDKIHYPLEVVNTLQHSVFPIGMYTHKLKFKVGASVICNGIRLVRNKILKNLIDATIIAGNFKRLQLPSILYYVIIINKSQKL